MALPYLPERRALPIPVSDLPAFVSRFLPEVCMRTSVVTDHALMRRPLELGGFRTKRTAIEAGLRLLVQVHSQKRLRALRGKIGWEGSLEKMRRD